MKKEVIPNFIESHRPQTNALYFIALVPDGNLRERVKLLKEEMRDRFSAAHALKSPAHITLQMPFRRNSGEELNIIQTIQRVATNYAPFEVALQGFDCFPPRVIFIRITEHESILRLHKKLNIQLKENLDFTTKELTSKVHPHMTIATRDLSEEAFQYAWPEFKNRKFDASFLATKIYLLKHNGTYWDIHKDFSFEG